MGTFIYSKMIQRQLNLNTQVDELLDNYEVARDEMQNGINDEILFKFNSVNLIIGKRGSGKTHMVMREALKIALISKYIWNHERYVLSPTYTQIFYVTDKVRDDTFNKFAQFIKDTGVELTWVRTEDAAQLIRLLAISKAIISDPQSSEEKMNVARKTFNINGRKGQNHTSTNTNTSPEDSRSSGHEYVRSPNEDNTTETSNENIEAAKASLNMQPNMTDSPDKTYIPHTLIIFDDCIGLFKKDTPLSKMLYENRQSRITYFLLLQDVQGISPSMKSNIDSLVVFGGFPRNKWNILMYQMPACDVFGYDDYVHLYSKDYVVLDYIDNTTKVVRRGNM